MYLLELVLHGLEFFKLGFRVLEGVHLFRPFSFVNAQALNEVLQLHKLRQLLVDLPVFKSGDSSGHYVSKARYFSDGTIEVDLGLIEER